jgi:small subunit ribosomal protein S17
MRERRRELVGRVTSDKMDKTVVVAVERLVRHDLYGKVVRRVKKYKAHNEDNEARAGDRVRIVESRPISREKRWVVTEIVEKAR